MITAKEYLLGKKEICNFKDCSDCPAHDPEGCVLGSDEEYPEEAIKVIEKFIKEQPLQTKRDKFIEVFGDVKIYPEWWDELYEKPEDTINIEDIPLEFVGATSDAVGIILEGINNLIESLKKVLDSMSEEEDKDVK